MFSQCQPEKRSRPLILKFDQFWHDRQRWPLKMVIKYRTKFVKFLKDLQGKTIETITLAKPSHHFVL